MKFTPTQRRILALLSDNRPHTPEELHRLLPDELGVVTNVRAHLTELRKKLREDGEDVSCDRVNGVSYYRRVRLNVYNAD